MDKTFGTFPLTIHNSQSGGKYAEWPNFPAPASLAVAEMPRRRLLLGDYSDEEEDEEIYHEQQQDHDNEVHLLQDPTANLDLPNPNPDDQEQVPISDDEFVDVLDTLTPPSPPDPPFVHSSPQSAAMPSVSSGCPVGDYLLRMGLKVKREWLDSCLSGLESSIRDHDVAAKARLCFQQFLFSDMNYCGGGVLPPNVDSMHLVSLPGPYVLQVDEIVNISCPLKSRYQDAPPGAKRCLKLSMTDGVQRIFGMEYRPIKNLQALAPAGLKVIICNIHVRRGLLMLVPEALEVLGGMVDEMEAARQRLVAEVNKPPRGKRSRNGMVPPLATRATMAAWPRDGVNVSVNNNSPTDVLGHTDSSTTVHRHINGSINVLGHTNNSVSVHGHTDSSHRFHGHIIGSNVTVATNSSTSEVAVPFQTVERGSNVAAPGNGSSQRSREEYSASTSLGNSIPNPSTTVVSGVEEMHIDASFDRENIMSDHHLNNEDVHMVDEFQHPLILSGDREKPFTYLASLSAKWAAVKEKTSSVQGKVKCFVTGVKGFQYKQRITYELRVYVDDGSLISEILIDHNVVLKSIGHSPGEVTAALSSCDAKRVGDMKETLKKFQIFLINFEGIMVIEINGISPIPVALEMNQGCPASDAWLLMRRLKSSAPGQTPQRPASDPIDISP